MVSTKNEEITKKRLLLLREDTDLKSPHKYFSLIEGITILPPTRCPSLPLHQLKTHLEAWLTAKSRATGSGWYGEELSGKNFSDI